MAAPSKTLMDFFQQPSAKRLKRVSSPPRSPLSSLNDAAASSLSTTTISSEQKRRMEFNKALALSKRNMKLCSEKVSKAIAAGVGFVKLEELLVEESWLEVLSGELQKPYALKLCEFVESEICHGSTPIYPPQHLISMHLIQLHLTGLRQSLLDSNLHVHFSKDPYHGPGQAMGLSFSVPDGVKVPSSLINIYKELQQDLDVRFHLMGIWRNGQYRNAC
ncbi:Uracil-DNA glycosylase, mitochondrial [Sesamum angolense]|uniref:Uracil-DNA glycosylase, mitochondrial n=1 Tax=Sesamum angolense TaxID=2727404 RepID=A0AAE2BZJ6_9LAMI|nr:Uracil-DNA glycosylase, mitochondrial [Sesamum angolense]